MKLNCNVIRDLLPLYADQICSDESRELVKEHLAECGDCSHKHQNRQGNDGRNLPKFSRFRISPNAKHHQPKEQRSRCHNRQSFLIAKQSFEGLGIDRNGQ